MLPAVTLTIKPCADACNLTCRYCYNSHGRTARNLDLVQLEKTLSGYKDLKLRILLSGGEPLLYPRSQMNELLALLSSAIAPDIPIQIQTNGTLLDQQWIELFSSYNTADNVNLSISMDPPEGNLRFNSCQEQQDLYDKVLMSLHSFPKLGIVSIVHKANMSGFINFTSKLAADGIKYLTANNMRPVTHSGRSIEELLLTEGEYLTFLKEYLLWWVLKKNYKNIQIQPLMSLFSSNANQLCLFSSMPEKCTSNYLIEQDLHLLHCEMLKDANDDANNNCSGCRIYEFCGGGCPAVKYDESFCNARHEFYDFLQEVKNGSNKIFKK